MSYITVNQKGVKLGVARGASLPDPKKLLQGTGKGNRHVVINTPADLRTPGLRQLVRAAAGRVEEGPRLNACARPFSQLSRWSPLREILSSVAWRSATRRSTRPRSPRFGSSPAPVAWGSSRRRHGAVMRGAQGSWLSAAILFVYAIPFSYAYGLLTAGTGALILFGTVQVTMIGGALVEGERPRPRQWVGLALAIAGLVYLLLPGLAAPSPAGAGLMALAGVAWALYSIRGRGAVDPVAQNGGNFVRSLPMTLIVSVLALKLRHVETSGAILAIVSGAVTSGLGYAVWYAALRGLTATRAALVQLLVPVITVTGGVLFLNEPLSQRVVLSAAIVIGGIALALTATEATVRRSNAQLPIPNSQHVGSSNIGSSGSWELGVD